MSAAVLSQGSVPTTLSQPSALRSLQPVNTPANTHITTRARSSRLAEKAPLTVSGNESHIPTNSRPYLTSRTVAGPSVPAVNVKPCSSESAPPKPASAIPQPKQKLTCPSPPPIIRDKKSTTQFSKGKLLGEGGFAKCYEVWDQSGNRFAAKVVSKLGLKTQKAKQKLFTEIRIHQAMKHPNIVRFHHVFEDTENVYMILELCENRTFVDLLKKRKRLTETEVRFYMNQMLNSLQYMHSRRVIHRDMKLGNLFLTGHMNIKIGDFGLATSLKEENERKKTICGTPNYIAPEVLFDQKNGHSYEVDIWSLGVIMYTLLIGKPPFQTKDVKAIYKKIKDNSYEFPDNVEISSQAKHLIAWMLTNQPERRPKIKDIYDHEWFLAEKIPEAMPVSALLALPSFPSTSSSVQAAMRTDSTSIVKKFIGGVQSRIPLAEMANLKIQSPALPLKHEAVTKVAAVQPVQVEKENLFKNTVQVTRLGIPVAGKTPVLESKKALNVPVSNATPLSAHYMAQTPPTKTAVNDGLKVMFSPPVATAGRRSMLETMFFHLDCGLSALKSNTLEKLPFTAIKAQAPKVFISKWIDYSNKYGLGYQLTNGHTGVYFNDSTTVIMSADGIHFEYLEYAKGSDKTVMNRHSHTQDHFPNAISKKVTLLRHFQGYMRDNLSQASSYNFVDEERTFNMDFLVKYMRTKHAVFFRLTNRTVQINFFDHTKLILSDDALVISFINRERQMSTHSLYSVLKNGEVEIISRLKYAKDILDNLTSKTAGSQVTQSPAPKKTM